AAVMTRGSARSSVPIYEYKCRKCGRLTIVFLRSAGSSADKRCKACGSKRLERAISAFAYRRSESSVLADYGAEPKRLEDYKDPRQIGRWTERKFKEMGVDMPKEAREMIDAAREGELPDPVKDL
ncbi:MAG: zinc ribbon domain-containing protein, partial [Dehalococcoidia bacterium]|nr:zinc ribbon domain-containing protein [Dehalococcoidia bacterium]